MSNEQHTPGPWTQTAASKKKLAAILKLLNEMAREELK